VDRASTEHLMTPVTATSGDPSTYPVQVAVVPADERPTDTDWHDATWTTSGSETFATLLVGPSGTVNPGPGTFRTWVKLTATPEVPVIPSARFEIT
jgi:hypothetical protein